MQWAMRHAVPAKRGAGDRVGQISISTPKGGKQSYDGAASLMLIDLSQ
jgi:hypothetical protein